MSSSSEETGPGGTQRPAKELSQPAPRSAPSRWKSPSSSFGKTLGQNPRGLMNKLPGPREGAAKSQNNLPLRNQSLGLLCPSPAPAAGEQPGQGRGVGQCLSCQKTPGWEGGVSCGPQRVLLAATPCPLLFFLSNRAAQRPVFGRTLRDVLCGKRSCRCLSMGKAHVGSSWRFWKNCISRCSATMGQAA